MDIYRYKAINEAGNTVSGTLEAESGTNASDMLALRGLIPLQITEENGDSSETLWNRLQALAGGVKAKELILFTKQFRSMLNAGVPIIRSMQVLEAQTESKALKQAITAITANIRQGSTLSDSFEKYPKIFSHLYCSMLRAGEISGNAPIYKLFEQKTEVKIWRATQTIRAISADQEISSSLQIPINSPILFIERITYSNQGQPIEYIQLYYPGSRHELVMELFRNPSRNVIRPALSEIDSTLD